MADARAQFRNDFGASANAAPSDPIQAAPDSLEMDQIIASHEGTGWISGCFVNAPGGMKVEIDDGVIILQNGRFPVRGKVLDIEPNPTGTPRRDSVRADGSGPYVVTGTAVPQPIHARMRLGDDGKANEVVLASVYVPANTTQGILKTYVTQAGVPPTNILGLRGKPISCEPIVSSDGLASFGSGIPYYNDFTWYDDTPGYEAYYCVWVNNFLEPVIGCRGINDRYWTRHVLAGTALGPMDDATGGSASDFTHRYVVIGMDASGVLWLAGNTHDAALRMIHSDNSMRVVSPDTHALRDITNWTSSPHPTGWNEAEVTFPMFGPLPSGDLLFMVPQASGGPGSSVVSLKRRSGTHWTEMGGPLDGANGGSSDSNETVLNARLGFLADVPSQIDTMEETLGGSIKYALMNLSTANWSQADPWALIENPLKGGATLANGHICALNPDTGLTDATYIGTGPSASAEYLADWFARTDITPVMTMHMIPTGTNGTETSRGLQLAHGAAGNFDGHYQTLAHNLIDAGWGVPGRPIIMRPGYEFNVAGRGTSAVPADCKYPADTDGSNGQVNHRLWVRHVIRAMKGIEPVDAVLAAHAANMQFAWCPGSHEHSEMTIASNYPGDDVIDLIGLDTYDYMHTAYTWAAQQAILESTTRYEPGWMEAFAGTPSQRTVTIAGVGTITGSGTKAMCFPEWGLGFGTNQGGDNAQFVAWMDTFIKTKNVQFACNFNRSPMLNGDNAAWVRQMQADWGTLTADVHRVLFDGQEPNVTDATAFIASAQIDINGDLHLIWVWRPSGGTLSTIGMYYAKITGLQDTTATGPSNVRAWRDPYASHDDPPDIGPAPHREIALPILRNPADSPGESAGTGNYTNPSYHFPIRVARFGGELDGPGGIGNSRLLNNPCPFFTPADTAGNPHAGYFSIVGQPSRTLGMGGTIQQFHLWFDPDMPVSPDSRILEDGWHVQQISDYVTQAGSWIQGVPAGSTARFVPLNTSDGRVYMIGTWPNEGYGGATWCYDLTGLTDTDGIPKPFKLHEIEGQGDFHYDFNSVKNNRLLMLMTRKDRIYKDSGAHIGDQPSENLSSSLADPTAVLLLMSYDTNQMDVIRAGMIRLPRINSVATANAGNLSGMTSTGWIGANEFIAAHPEVTDAWSGVINIGTQYAGKILFARLTTIMGVDGGWLAAALLSQNFLQINAQVMTPGEASNIVPDVVTPDTQPPNLSAGPDDPTLDSPQTNPLNNIKTSRIAAQFCEDTANSPAFNSKQSQWVGIPNFRDLNGGAGRLILQVQVGNTPVNTHLYAATWELGVLEY